MREIKFRAWDGEQIMETFSVQSNGDGINYRGDIMTSWKLMQYTGLKDKKGKEIFEGDVIKWDREGNEQVMHSTSWDGRIDPDTAPFMSAYGTTCGRYFRTFMNIYDPVRFGVVIGNIYENPELLNKPTL
jgi:uncharacterized phage protein (TIGR01671 family)